MILPALTKTAKQRSGPGRMGLMLIISGLFLWTACDENLVYEKNKELDGGVWKSTEVVKFNVDLNDVNQAYDFYLNIRITGDYRFANMFLFMRTLYPDGRISTDTVECYFADMDGRWLGKRSGSLVDNRILLRKNMKFEQAGAYSFEFEQGMRDTVLAEVRDFGIRIERSEP